MRVAPLLAAAVVALLVAALATVCTGVMIGGVLLLLIMPQTDYVFGLMLLAGFAFFAFIFVVVFREMHEKFADMDL
ncbi:MAG TPA: hypothetical protein VFZ35_05210 [Sphingomicrobium sp.]